MRNEFTSALVATLLVVAAAPQPVRATAAAEPAPKTLITDGSVVHTANNLWNNVTNWGLIGSRPTQPTPFAHAPSGRWPGESGTDYLWAAGFWVGGTVLGEMLVSTGQYDFEIIAGEAAGDTIYATAEGAPGGVRYPWPDADDDGDGSEDEDPLDGRDNDGDGLVDEDFAAAGDVEYRCVMSDTTARAQSLYPDHTPLNVQVVQRSFQWTDPLAADFIGYEYGVTNIGVVEIQNVHAGMFADFDIGNPADDLVGSWVGLVRNEPTGAYVPVAVGYMVDAAASGPVPGYVGWVLCGLETDAVAGGPADPFEMWSFNHFNGQVSFEDGGDPTNDSERYRILHLPHRDPDPSVTQVADYRMLLSAPTVTALAPGETIVFRAALVAGSDLDALLQHASEAVLTAVGATYDRDGDPANGEEFRVPWLRPEDAPVPALGGRLVPARVPGGVALGFDVAHAGGLPIAVTRRPLAALGERRWDDVGAAGTVIDTDAGPWPRTYDLLAKAANGEVLLDSVEVPGPAGSALELHGSPNPFNPRLTLAFALPEAGWARLAVHDLRGRVVRGLFAEPRPAGADHVVWDGLDDGGRAVASGVYTVLLETATAAVEQRVTLVR